MGGVYSPSVLSVYKVAGLVFFVFGALTLRVYKHMHTAIVCSASVVFNRHLGLNGGRYVHVFALEKKIASQQIRERSSSTTTHRPNSDGDLVL